MSKNNKEENKLKARKEEILEVIKDIDKGKRIVILPLIDNFLFVENQLQELRKLPLIRVHPSNPARQEITQAGKLYKDYMQTYINSIKVIQKELMLCNIEGDSLLVKMLKEFENE